MAGNERFAGLLTQHIQNRLQSRFGGERLTPQTMRDIRATIRETIDQVFDRSRYVISPTARGWLTNQVFQRTYVSEDTRMADLIVINEYKLSQLTYDDLRLLSDLFVGTNLAQGLLDELHARKEP